MLLVVPVARAVQRSVKLDHLAAGHQVGIGPSAENLTPTVIAPTDPGGVLVGVDAQGDAAAPAHQGGGQDVAPFIGLAVEDQSDCLRDLSPVHASARSSVTRTRDANSSASSQAFSRRSLNESSV